MGVFLFFAFYVNVGQKKVVSCEKKKEGVVKEKIVAHVK